jgi:hypothetical protein
LLAILITAETTLVPRSFTYPTIVGIMLVTALAMFCQPLVQNFKALLTPVWIELTTWLIMLVITALIVFQIDDVKAEIAFQVVVMKFLIVLNAEVMKELTAFTAVVTAFLIAFHAVEVAEVMAFQTVDTTEAIALNTVDTTLEIAFAAVDTTEVIAFHAVDVAEVILFQTETMKDQTVFKAETIALSTAAIANATGRMKFVHSAFQIALMAEPIVLNRLEISEKNPVMTAIVI